MSLSLPIFRNSKTTKVIRLSRNPSKTHQKMRARKESPTVLSKAAMSQEALTRPRSPAERPKQSQLSMGHAKRTIEKKPAVRSSNPSTSGKPSDAGGLADISVPPEGLLGLPLELREHVY
jgi:hypothetical protein